MRPAGKVVPRITRGTCWAISSSLPTPFCTLQTAPSAKIADAAAIAEAVCIDLVATMPKSQGGISPASVRAWTGATISARPVSRSPRGVDRRDVVGDDVVGPHLDVLERRQMRGEEASNGAAADDADAHHDTTAGACARRHEASRARIRRYIAVDSGTSTPRRCASATSAPVMNSTSVGLRASTSSSIDGRCA